MASATLCISGFSRETEPGVRSAFEAANARLGGQWTLASENDASVVLIDLDSVAGYMIWLKARGAGKTTIGVSAGNRADTDHLINPPVQAEALAKVLDGVLHALPASAKLTGPAPSMPPLAAATEEAEIGRITGPAPTPPPPAPVPTPAPAPVPAPAAMPTEPAAVDPARVTGSQAAFRARPMRLVDILHSGSLGMLKWQLPDAPLLVIDGASQTYLGGNALKPLLPYAEAAVKDGDLVSIDADEFAQHKARLGSQPLSRLLWLAALAGGHGGILGGHDPNARYKLNKWPQTEREFPKHFRIATAMMKGPAKLTEIAEASGMTLAEVTDFVNASLATGYASPV
jgi:hypothetical protein